MRNDKHVRACIHPGGGSLPVEAVFENSPHPGFDVMRAGLERDVVFRNEIEMFLLKPHLPHRVGIVGECEGSECKGWLINPGWAKGSAVRIQG